MYVYPVVDGHAAAAGVPRVRGAAAADPFTLTPAEIGANRNAWIDEWTQIVLQ